MTNNSPGAKSPGNSPYGQNPRLNSHDLGRIARMHGLDSRAPLAPTKDFDKLTLSDYQKVTKTKFQRKKVQELEELIAKVEQREESVIPIPEFGDEYKIDYKKVLNEQQLKAVVCTDGPLLVIAGAGTGKTHLLTYRVSYLIESGVNPAEILLLTFTRKASEEMLSRVNQNRTDKSTTDVSGGTFHSMALEVIINYLPYFDLLPNITIADNNKSKGIIDLARTELNLVDGRNTFPTKSELLEIISKSRNKDISIKQVVEKWYPKWIDQVNSIEDVKEWYTIYKKSNGALDYDDMLFVLRDTLRDNDELRSIIQEKYRYIMVDEYQDTNLVQKDIVDLLANGDQNVMVVGDDAQSIYGFRGANYENILRFAESYPDAKIIKLNENYRSVQSINDFTNSVNNSFALGYKKQLTSANKGAGKKPKVKKKINRDEEAKYIADKIVEARERDIPFSEIAILSRSTWHWQIVENELRSRGIPFITVGGIKFTERAHIADMLSYLSVISNPLDVVAWHRILKLEEGIGKTTAARIVTDIAENDYNIESFDSSKYKKITTLLNMVKSASSTGATLPQIISLVYQYYEPILMERDDNPHKSKLDINVFRELTDKYDTLMDLLRDFALDPFSDEFENGISASQNDDEGNVTISTIHSAKGLEWSHVFVIHALDGLFPSVKALTDFESVEEEHRVFYVATTRAKNHLFVTMPSVVKIDGCFFSLPSRFLIKTDKNTFKFQEQKPVHWKQNHGIHLNPLTQSM